MSNPKIKKPGRPRKPAGAEDQTRFAVLRVAAQMFMHNGYERVSLEQIAEACSVTKATIYYYFSNKAELYTEALTETLKIVQMHVQRMLNQDKPIAENLKDVAIGHLSSFRNDQETLMNEAEKHLQEKQIKRIRDAQEAIHLIIAGYFEEQQRLGHLREGNPYFLSHSFSAMLMAGHREAVKSQLASVESIAEAVVHLFWNGAGTSRQSD